MAQLGDKMMSEKSRPSHERFPELYRKGPCVDRSECGRTTPMKVLCFGLPRTGTASMRVALANLNVSPVHHMVDVIYNPDDVQWFKRANDARNHPSESPPFTKAHWDRLLGDCQGTIDAPTAFFAD